MGVEGIGMRNMNIVVLSYGWEFMYMYVGVDFIECIYWVCFEMMEVLCKFLDFFLRGEGVVVWGFDFYIVKKKKSEIFFNFSFDYI